MSDTALDYTLPLYPEDYTPAQLGTSPGNEYFQEHRDRWEMDIMTKLESLGVETALYWPNEPVEQDKVIYQCRMLGRIPQTLRIKHMAFDRVAPPSVTAEVSKWPTVVAERFDMLKDSTVHPFLLFTDSEQWWDGPAWFFVNDAKTLLQACVYFCKRVEPGLKQGERRGRPRVQVAQERAAATAAGKGRYQEWLDSVAAHKQKVQEAREAWQAAQAEAERCRLYMRELEKQTPKWER